MKNNIKITRVAGKDAICEATIKLRFDATNPKAAKRLAKLLRELIPQEERAQFVSDFQEAAANAGFKASAG